MDGKAGYKEFIIDPDFSLDLTFVNSSLDTIYGLIKCNWKRSDNTITVALDIPINSIATFKIPSKDPESIKIGEGILESIQTPAHTEIKLGSGKYEFSFPDSKEKNN